MSETLIMIIALSVFWIAVFGSVRWTAAPQLLFTRDGIGVTFLTNLVVIGAVAIWIGAQIYVLGNDPWAQEKPPTQSKMK